MIQANVNLEKYDGGYLLLIRLIAPAILYCSLDPINSTTVIMKAPLNSNH